ncbi:uncharacterized protein EV422DRAFT_224173 [Fimicolochytrium jonesii]|uniref:uncharacterized protein n=1 Tax=Fimicolochytrium jonesii TaxID=1396493 RepID=UPI0022FE086C|nr:uncharacterized protein EV422DRAFT_224173 [Fimicolochytrium jonesii]KAI8817415.1 hypothetical protein EV422DRAFT_224173 [Fimicolochytrium jonesii]
MSAAEGEETVTFKLSHGKKVYDISVPKSNNISQVKQQVEELTGVHALMQKLLFKGMLKDDKTVEEAGLKDGVKVILMASKVEDIVKLATAAKTTTAPVDAAPVKRLSLSEQTEHKKVLDKGKPPNAEPGLKGRKLPLPANGLRDMFTQRGDKVRLTFKLELDQVWIGTSERTQKVNMNSIKNVKSEPIKGHEEYHILALQLGPTDKSNYYIYWVPCQYVDSVKDAILGSFASWP